MALSAYVQQENLISISGIRGGCFEEVMFNLMLGRWMSKGLVSDSRSPMGRGPGRSLEVRENRVRAASSVEPLDCIKGLTTAQSNGNNSRSLHRGLISFFSLL